MVVTDRVDWSLDRDRRPIFPKTSLDLKTDQPKFSKANLSVTNNIEVNIAQNRMRSTLLI